MKWSEKNSFYKSWAHKLIFPNEISLRKILIIFDIETLIGKSEFCNFVGLITPTKNVFKNFQCNFCDQWSIRYSFNQISLTWSKTCYCFVSIWGRRERKTEIKIYVSNSEQNRLVPNPCLFFFSLSSEVYH